MFNYICIWKHIQRYRYTYRDKLPFWAVFSVVSSLIYVSCILDFFSESGWGSSVWCFYKGVFPPESKRSYPSPSSVLVDHLLSSWWFNPISTHLNHISQIGSSRQVRVKIWNVKNHYLALYCVGIISFLTFCQLCHLDSALPDPPRHQTRKLKEQIMKCSGIHVYYTWDIYMSEVALQSADLLPVWPPSPASSSLSSSASSTSAKGIVSIILSLCGQVLRSWCDKNSTKTRKTWWNNANKMLPVGFNPHVDNLLYSHVSHLPP